MATVSDIRDCLFCRIASGQRDELEWYDQPLTMIPGVGGAIAGLGAFVPGYVLVFPDQHVESTLRIPSRRTGTFRTLARHVASAVSRTYGPVTIFEHGSCPRPDTRRSACLSHAHLHVLPGSYKLTSYLPPATDNLHRGRPEQSRLTSSGYLFLKEPPAAPQFYEDPGISQFFRRCIADNIGVGDQWDYLAYPHLDNVSATINDLEGRLPQTAPIRHTTSTY